MKTDIPIGLDYSDVLIVPGFSTTDSRRDGDISWQLGEFKFQIPVISSNMDTITGIKMMKKMAQLGGLGIHHRYCLVNVYQKALEELRVAYPEAPAAFSVGNIDRDDERIDWCIEHADIICIDIAHGDSLHMIDTLEFIRDLGFEGPIIAGNVCTPEAVSCLKEHGATLVKVGIGPGAVCTTRSKTGVGMFQFTAVQTSSAAGRIIADGGIKQPGDACKALAAGSTAVMIGGILAGTDCVPGWDEAMTFNEEGFNGGEVAFRGMASKEARQSFTGKPANNLEGLSVQVKCKPKGSTEQVITDIIEGVKSAMSYVGASNLNEFREKARFVRKG